MRRGEVLALRWRNVDLEGGVVRVVESLEQTKTSIRFKSPKIDRTRAVDLPGFAVQELRRLKRRQAEELLMLGIRQAGETVAASKPNASIHSPNKADQRPAPDQASRFATQSRDTVTGCWRASEDCAGAVGACLDHHHA